MGYLKNDREERSGKLRDKKLAKKASMNRPQLADAPSKDSRTQSFMPRIDFSNISLPRYISAREMAWVLKGSRKGSELEWMARCPAHNDKKPSLSISEKENGKCLLHCFASCEQDDVLDELRRKYSVQPRGAKNIPYFGDLGFATAVYDYHNAAGKVVFQHMRFDPLGTTKKEFRPYIPQTKQYTFPSTRPLYNLHKMRRYPDKVILVVEGEKTAEAAQRLFPKMVVTTWAGGSKAVNHVDWSPLVGRRVIIAPDNDEAGFLAAKQIKEITCGVIVKPPSECPVGWDLADPLPKFIDVETIISQINAAARKAVPMPSIAKREAQDSSSDDDGVIFMDKAKSKATKWLLKNFIPRQELIFVEGDPEAGKTTFLLGLIKIFADTGILPNGDEWKIPYLSLYLTQENDIESVIKPKLEALGLKNQDMVGVCPLPFILDDEGFKKIERMVKKHRPQIVVIDSLMDYFGEGRNSNSANEVAGTLIRLVELAHRYKFTLFVVRHMGKEGKNKAIYRGIGSIQFAGSARCIIQVGYHPRHAKKDMRVAACAKNSKGPKGASFLFTIEERTLKIGDKYEKFGIPAFQGTDEITAEDLNSGNTKKKPIRKTKEAELHHRLHELFCESKGKLSSSIIEEMKEEGYSENSIRQCLHEIADEPKPIKQRGRWYYTLKDKNIKT